MIVSHEASLVCITVVRAKDALMSVFQGIGEVTENYIYLHYGFMCKETTATCVHHDRYSGVNVIQVGRSH